MNNTINNTKSKVYYLNDDQLFVNENSIVTFAFEGENVAEFFPLGFANEDLNLGMGSVNKFNTLNLEDYKNVYIIGLGKNTADFNLSSFRKRIKPFLKSLDEDVNFDLISTIFCDKVKLAELLTEEFIEEKYEFEKISAEFKKQAKIQIYLASDVNLEGVIERATIKAQSVNITRNLINLPSNYLVPQTYVELVLNLIKEQTNISAKVMKTEELIQNDFGLIKDVNAGSANDAYVVCLEYNNAEDDNFKTIVGKGITFDTGGLSLKVGGGLVSMKGDMAGSATAVGVIFALAKLNVKTNLRVILGISENSLSASSYQVDAVLTSKSKKTVEIVNTDAEGRLVLADLITYAQEFTTDEIISISTLTGSNANYFGGNITPIHTNDLDTAQKISSFCNELNQFSWVMPMNQFENVYREQITNSPVADLTNIGKGNDGIIAGVFLNEFIENQDTKFVHIDIAGTSFNKTATGVMVKPLINYLLER